MMLRIATQLVVLLVIAAGCRQQAEAPAPAVAAGDVPEAPPLKTVTSIFGADPFGVVLHGDKENGVKKADCHFHYGRGFPPGIREAGGLSLETWDCEWKREGDGEQFMYGLYLDDPRTPDQNGRMAVANIMIPKFMNASDAEIKGYIDAFSQAYAPLAPRPGTHQHHGRSRVCDAANRCEDVEFIIEIDTSVPVGMIVTYRNLTVLAAAREAALRADRAAGESAVP